MTKDQIHQRLLDGWILIQEERDDDLEIKYVDELIKENVAGATKWDYNDRAKCNLRIVLLKSSSKYVAINEINLNGPCW